MWSLSESPKHWGSKAGHWTLTLSVLEQLSFFSLTLAPGILLPSLHNKAGTVELIQSIWFITARDDVYYFSTLNMNDELSWGSNSKFSPSYAAY